MTVNRFDVAIIGAGPNGLICGAYLARCGLNVVLLEARHETGGGLETLELAGFRYNLHAVYHMMAMQMPCYRDFDLDKKGVKYIFPPVQCATVYDQGPPLLLYRDGDKTADYIAAHFSSTDGHAYRRMYADFKEFSEKILIPLTYIPPVPFVEQTLILNNAKDDVGKRYNEIADLTPLDILSAYGFQEPVKSALLNLFTMWGMSPYELGFLFPLYVYRMTDTALVCGGSHRLSSALYRTFVEAGGTVMDRAEVVRVLVKGGGVEGVMTADGTEITAKAVISTCNPRQNFLEFIDPAELPAEVVESARKWEWEKSTFFGLHLALRSAPVYGDSTDVNHALTTFFGVNDTDELLAHLETIERGRLPEKPMGHASCPSLFDPLQAPKGYHVGRWECLVPFDVDWDTETEPYAQKCLAEWKAYAPGIEPLNQLAYPPTYIELKNKSMTRGSFKHGAYIPLQMGYLRPNDLCSRNFTPVERFYVAGASSYPGGMILGGGGYLAANAIADDFGLDRSWREPEYMQAAREAGIIPN